MKTKVIVKCFILTIAIISICALMVCSFTGCGKSDKNPTPNDNTQKPIPDEPSVHTHTVLIDEARAATCTATGLTEGKHCSECGEILVAQTSIPMLKHVAGEWVIDKAVTCTENGVNSRYCTSCGVKMDSTIAFSNGHMMSITVTREHNCTEDGIVLHECTRNGCGYSYEITTKAEHNMQLEEKVDATCTVDGYITYGCTKCNYEETTIIYCGHNYTSEITKKSTGDEKGEITYSCSICGDSYVEEIPMLKPGISVLLIEDTSAWRTNTNVVLLNSLVDAGYISYWEKLASSQLYTTDLLKYGMVLIANDQTGATYDNVIKNKVKLQNFAKEGGVLIYGACDQGWSGGNMSSALLEGIKKGNYYSYRNYIVNAEHPIVTGALTEGISLTNELLYHNYASHTYFYHLPQGSNIILQDANGNPTLVEYEIGTGHVIVSGLTWEHNAKYKYNPEGSFASTVYDDLIIYATTLANTCEHEYDEGIEQKASCTGIGYALHTCTICGFAYKDKITQPLGHTVNEWIQTKAPTCTKNGEESGICTVCKETQTRTVSATAHAESKWVIDIEPTCTEAGSRLKICEACEIIISKESIDALGHNLVHGECTNCDFSCYSQGLEFVSNGDGTCYVSGIGTCTDTDIIIPLTSPDGDRVTGIGKKAFYNCTDITSVVIPDNVTSIASYAFYGCQSLISVVIPDGITSIASHAFYGCQSLVSVVIPDGVTSIASYAFYGCQSLVSVVIPDGVTSIESCTFRGCTNLASVVIPNSVASIGNGAFLRCESLSSVVIPDSVTSIKDNTFSSCTSLTYVLIPNSVTSIEWGAFNNCTSLASVVIPNSVTSIGRSAFQYCSSLTSVVIPDSVTSIGDEAFQDCYSLTSVVIPNSVTSIGDQMFYDCYNLISVIIGDSVTSIGDEALSSCDRLTEITVSENNVNYKSIDGNLYTKDGKTLIQYAIGKTATEFTIPDSVTSIGDMAFQYCSSLTSVVIPNNVTSIGDEAFYYCNSLTSVVIPNSVTSIGDEAFFGCSRLASVVIPNSVTSIGDEAFFGCSRLASVVIPNSVTSIGNSVFLGCSKLTDVYYTGSEIEWANIVIGEGNKHLTDATIHYNYEE